MLKICKYLKKSVPAIFTIVILLFIQAYCDLSLPSYTSNIVNVGIQQGGIENAVIKTIREEQLEKILIFVSKEDSELILSSYTRDENGIYELNNISSETENDLNDILGKAMLVVYGIESGSEETLKMKEQMGIPKEADIFEILKNIPNDKKEEIALEMRKTIDELPEAIVTQSAILYIKNEYQAQGIDLDRLQMKYVLNSGLVMIGFALLIMLVSIAVTLISCRVASAFSRDLREMTYKKVLGFSNTEFDKFSTASLITRSTNDIQQVQLLMTMIFRIVLYAPILGVGGVLKVLGTNTSMAWIIGVAVVAILLVVVILFMVAMPKFKMLQVLIDKLNLVTREIITGIPVIRAFSTQKHEEERFEEANMKLMKTNLFVNRCMTFMMPLMMFIMNAITVLIVYKGAYGIDEGAMQVGDLMAFIQYTMQIIMSFLMITMMSIMLPRAGVSAVRINEILDTKATIEDAKMPKEGIKEKKGYVEFKNVSFAYPDAKENVLSNISFTAKPSETTAIIGSTGSGKSTLVNLIPRFFDVTEGEILVDGINIKDYTLHDLHDKFGYVPQKGILFSGTIDSNIRYGCEDAPLEQIKKSAEIAQAMEFINEKPEKFDSEIAQGGTNVSGGQKQRLSIARAIAKQPEIFIFDDSFSALDYKTDVVLRRALKQETKDATTIIVAQRISTILHADQIIVLDEGKIAGIGTHKELLKNCEVYMQIAASQLSKEELENG